MKRCSEEIEEEVKRNKTEKEINTKIKVEQDEIGEAKLSSREYSEPTLPKEEIKKEKRKMKQKSCVDIEEIFEMLQLAHGIQKEKVH